MSGLAPTRKVSSHLVSKFVALYTKLFDDYTPEQIAPHEEVAQFWSNLLSLDVDVNWLSQKFRSLSKDDLVEFRKPFLNTLFSICLHHFITAEYADSRKDNAIDTLAVFVRCCLERNLAGWEVMEVFAGGVSRSDAIFLDLVSTIDGVMSDITAPPSIRHKTLQLTVLLACGLGQLSPGAYLLRRNLFPGILSVIKQPETRLFTFEAALLLAVLANFHKTDAAKLNPYLASLRSLDDREALKTICWSAGYAVESVTKAYQEIYDDSPPTLATTFGNLLASFRPDKALSITPTEPLRDLLKNQPIEAAVILLPIFELLHVNAFFIPVLVEPLIVPPEDAGPQTQSSMSSQPSPNPLILTLLTASSYMLTHASSVSSSRAIAYAHLCLNMLLLISESELAMGALVRPSRFHVRLCRQRQPTLPQASSSGSSRPPICAILDCCVLWLRHNLHKKLEVRSYTTCIWTVRRILWSLNRSRVRLEYHWEELWRVLLTLLEFLVHKLDESRRRTREVEELIGETVLVLEYALRTCEAVMGKPQDVHQFVYELIRGLPILEAHLGGPLSAGEKGSAMTFNESGSKRKAGGGGVVGIGGLGPGEALRRVVDVAGQYAKVVKEAEGKKGGRRLSANEVVKLIAGLVEKESGVKAPSQGAESGSRSSMRDAGGDDEVIPRSDMLVELGIVRYAYADGMALMPGPD